MSHPEFDRLVQYLQSHVALPRHLRFRIDEVQIGRAVFSLEVADIHLNGAGSMHGGVHAALMDSAMAVALITHRLRVSTTQMNLHYLEAARTGSRLVCTGEVVHRGKRSALAEAKVHDEEGRLLATATASFRIFEQEPAAMAEHTQPEAEAETR